VNRHVLAPIGTALDRVADERSEVDAERDAFATFAARVDACPARAESSVTAPDPAASVRTTGLGAVADAQPTARLRRAYRETVMAVDHYEAVYGEPLAVNVAAEFGADVATALCRDVQFTPPLKRALSDAATSARADRERFGEVLQRERRSLVDAEAALDDIVTAIRRHPGDHPDDAPSLAELERRCERVGTERQRVVQRQRRFSREGDALYEYLYGDQSWTYPVLSVVATLSEDLSAMRDGPSDGTR
jgi:hypothetical protein